jgi:GlpG protein
MSSPSPRQRLRLSFNSPVVLSFTALCLVSQILRLVLTPEAYYSVFSAYRSRFGFLFVLRLFTHVFGHASWEHLLGNMMYFLILGPMLEEKYGSGRLVLIIVIASLITGLADVMLFSDRRVLGASGVVFAFILLSSITMRDSGRIPMTFLLVAALFLGQQLLQIFKDDNVSQLSHIIGGVVGSLTGFVLSGRKTAADAGRRF